MTSSNAAPVPAIERGGPHSLHQLRSNAPFRLDLTAALIRRFPARSIDTQWQAGSFVCALDANGVQPQIDAAAAGTAGVADSAAPTRAVRRPAVATIRQSGSCAIDVRIDGSIDTAAALAQIHTMLGLDVDTSAFHAAAQNIDWLRPLDERFRGVRPARTPDIWQATATAIVYQSVSMLAAGAVIERLIGRFGERVGAPTGDLQLFPSTRTIAAASEADIFAVGVTRAKAAALRAAADALTQNAWLHADLTRLSTPALCARLTQLRGVGPWSAAVIALNGFGRLDTFPLRDSGVARSIGHLSRGNVDAVGDVLSALGAQRGMLYHYLALTRLEQRGRLPAGEPVGRDRCASAHVAQCF